MQKNLIVTCTPDDYNKKMFPPFKWWNDTKGKRKKITTIRRDELPIPKLPEIYPYRYTSAGPSTIGRTKKEMDIHKTLFRIKPKVIGEDKLDLHMVTQVKGYETTSMTASMAPFIKTVVDDSIVIGRGIAPGLNEPLYVPFKSSSKFDKYIIDTLHPGWRDDPLYKRCVKFHFRDTPEDEGPTDVSKR
ncbi:uncharacterized protein LOC131936219 [Physella acuta]|uniref:uncharacterized protein LOC131936219 n=1 Tax=Physella acuta TaxID=109671 RepID=UPI0027DCB530|nr:uncharacterized protein LOC131936219 [Physella acuta]